ncbi:MAG: BON domain-containing protein [Pseudomonadota bacterium]
MNQKVSLFLLMALALTQLSACVAVAVGGATAGAMVAHDRRTSDAMLEDQKIEMRARRLLNDHRDIRDASDISVTSYNLRVLLTGEAETVEISRRFANLVARLPRVASVFNEVRSGSSAGFWDETEDAYLTSKVKLALFGVDGKGFDPSRVKVVVSQEDVFVMGLVTRREGNAAIDEVRRVNGVKRVVDIFEYTDG